MTAAPVNGPFYADPTSLTALKRDAAAQTPEALRETARQFEGLLTSMMLKSMRDASPGDSMLGSDQQDFYQDMFDQQLATQLSKGKGLGLADVLVRQLIQGIAADAPATPNMPPTTQQWPPQSREEFVQAVLPGAREAGKRLGVDPTSIIAQAALESGWGTKVPTGPDGQPSFNLFGIKAGSSWHGAATAATTNEFENGRMQSVQAQFRSYDSPEHSLRDYTSFLTRNPRYAAALGTGSDTAAFGSALQSAGYATDPNYANKLDAVARELKSRFSLPIMST